MDTLQSIIIAIVEGLTEFLPVSSTGHMIITENILGVKPDAFVNAYTVIIQFGAILSVVCLYWKRFFRLGNVEEGVTGVKAFLQKYDFYWKLLVAFIPAAVIGLALGDFIEGLLGNVWVVAVMLVLVGVLLLFVDRIFNNKTDAPLTERRAFVVGIFQCIAMIPGTSRSFATIAGGMQQGLTRKTAAEFSFFLAVPTMAAASGYELLKMMMDDTTRTLLADNMGVLLVGCVVAFIVALLAIKFFISFLTKYGFKAFGWYRIIVGGIIIIMLASGMSLQMVD
ncbi:MAG: undecaprenyl-diphosphate phosphatase [Bacteroidales bacterium]|nr:undecaprenyl-diphosphate phosphatase [Candidatus Sodaliphilus aphodohippi]